MYSELQEKINKNGMVISRIPSWARQTIQSVAESEHANDYGACIAQFIREANEYRILKAKFFDNDLNVTLSDTNKQGEKDTGSDITFADGSTIKFKGGIK